jgi:MoxR-like ATPase
MNYTKAHFDPETNGGRVVKGTEDVAFAWTIEKEDRTIDKDVYVFSPLVVLSVNVAIATRRPLLIAGEPGSGKTRLAAAVAAVLQRQFYARTVTSRTQAADLLWTFDTLRRFSDATTPNKELQPDQYYVEPGVIWWGFNPTTAAQRGMQPLADKTRHLQNPDRNEAGEGAVVLIDEIDKADPDVPNDLLEPFDVRRFTVKETNDPIRATRDTLLMLTTNGERDLPPAFVRRCVMLVLPEPDQPWFERVAAQHFPIGNNTLHTSVAAEVQRLRNDTKAGTRKPSTAEFIDALRVCSELSTDVGSDAWADIINAVLLKTDQPPKKPAATGAAGDAQSA